ncbi:MAG TPA: hypothetical protein VH796_17795 [Nitrososphaeraceae archaeon]|jgi:hypothetical protein
MADEAGVQQLGIAVGLKELLTNSGFTTARSITKYSPAEISKLLGIEVHVAKIIIDEAQKLVDRPKKEE